MKKETAQIVLLASRSPRRVELLKQIGIECIVLPADIDESTLADESPIDYVKRVAKLKALTVAENMKTEYTYMPILSADTAVTLNDEILGKPATDGEAIAMLKKLSKKKHEVHTAVAIYQRENIKIALSTTLVEMMSLTQVMIDDYIASGEHRDKAGSYGIQGAAGSWIKRIEGSYTGVMGLPLYETTQLINSIAVK